MQPTDPSPRPRPPRCRLWLSVLALAYACFHIACWSPVPPDVDPINFYLALSDYDIGHDRPHPPGYPLLVAAARLMQPVVGPAYAYQALLLLLLLATGGLIYGILAHRGRPRAGLFAAALLWSHPLVISATVVQESYLCDLFFVSALAWLYTLRDRLPWAVLITAAVGVLAAVAMVRVVSAVLLLPLAWSAVLLKPGTLGEVRRFALAAGLVTAMGLVVLGAVQATQQLGGGAEAYAAAVERVMGNAFAQTSVVGGAPLMAHLQMLIKLFGWLAVLAIPVLLAAAAAVLTPGPWPRRGPRWDDALLVVLTVGPFLAIYSLIYYLKPTYLLPFAGLAAVLVALCGDGIARRVRRPGLVTWAVAGLVLAGLLGYRFAPHAWLPGPIANLTHGRVAERAGDIAAVRRTVDALPEESFILIDQMPGGVTTQVLRLYVADGYFGVTLADAQTAMIYDGTWSRTLPLNRLGEAYPAGVWRLTADGVSRFGSD
jgi:hypothetical protein